MFIGHFAVGFAAKRAAPRSSLGWLLAAPVFLDLLWPIFVILGIERVRITPGVTAYTPLTFDSYPWSHSLLMSVVWGLLFGGMYWRATGYARGGVVIALGVVSHWVLDVITHIPDMPIAPGLDVRVGLGLWNSFAGTVIVELAMLAAGLWLYVRTTVARDRIGQWAFVGFVLFLLVAYAASSIGPPPPSVAAMTYGSLALWLVLLWAAWFDAHRDVRAAT